MSQVTTFKTSVKFRNLQLLKEALKGMGQISNTYRDYYSQEQKCDVAISTSVVTRGIGFVFENGEYKVKGDALGYKKHAESLINSIGQRYQELGNLQVLKKHNYLVASNKRDEKNNVLILARRY